MKKALFIVSIVQKNIIPIIGVFAYGMAGILLMFIALYIFEKMVGCNIREELADRNFSVGVSVAALLLGAALIASASIRGRTNAPSSSKHVHPSTGGGCGAPVQQQIHSRPKGPPVPAR